MHPSAKIPVLDLFSGDPDTRLMALKIQVYHTFITIFRCSWSSRDDVQLLTMNWRTGEVVLVSILSYFYTTSITHTLYDCDLQNAHGDRDSSPASFTYLDEHHIVLPVTPQCYEGNLAGIAVCTIAASSSEHISLHDFCSNADVILGLPDLEDGAYHVLSNMSVVCTPLRTSVDCADPNEIFVRDPDAHSGVLVIEAHCTTGLDLGSYITNIVVRTETIVDILSRLADSTSCKELPWAIWSDPSNVRILCLGDYEYYSRYEVMNARILHREWIPREIVISDFDTTSSIEKDLSIQRTITETSQSTVPSSLPIISPSAFSNECYWREELQTKLPYRHISKPIEGSIQRQHSCLGDDFLIITDGIQ